MQWGMRIGANNAINFHLTRNPNKSTSLYCFCNSWIEPLQNKLSES